MSRAFKPYRLTIGTCRTFPKAFLVRRGAEGHCRLARYLRWGLLGPLVPTVFPRGQAVETMCRIEAGFIGRGDWIRTSDPLRPRQVRYQAALRPDLKSSIVAYRPDTEEIGRLTASARLWRVRYGASPAKAEVRPPYVTSARSQERLAEAIDLVEVRHSGRRPVDLHAGRRTPSRWFTLAALRILRWHDPAP
jgi:hypothetical protein